MSNQNNENTKEIIVNGRTFVPLISEKEVQDIYKNMAKFIYNDSKNRTKNGITLITVQNGASICATYVQQYLADLGLFKCDTTYLQTKSYQGIKSSGELKYLEAIDFEKKVKGNICYLIEDIIDTGLSIRHIYDSVNKHNPKYLGIVVFLLKPNAYSYHTKKLGIKKVKIAHVGKEIGDKFVIGCGLDYDGSARNLRYVGVLKK